jgi:hypothetical protein
MAKPSPIQLTFTAPDPRRKAELYDLIAKVFSQGRGYYGFRDYLTKAGYIESSHYDWLASQVGLLNGRMLTHIGVWDYQMRIGSARVRSGGLGVVATDGDFRHRGLMDQTMDATIDAMRRYRYDVSVLFGIPGFYHRYGYTRAWNAASWTVKVDDLSKEAPAGRVRRFRPRRRMADLEALYNKEYARVTGTAVRPTYARKLTYLTTGWRWDASAGQPAGYVAVLGWPDKPEVVEQAGDAGQILRVLAQQCRREKVKEIKFYAVPWDSELARQLRRGNVQVSVEYVRSGRAMIRVLDLPSTARKLCGELTARLRAVGQKPWPGRLRIQLPDQAVDLTCRSGQVAALAPQGRPEHAIRGGWEIAQLLVGAGDPADIARSYGIALSGQAGRLLGALFPDQHPLICCWDYF